MPKIKTNRTAYKKLRRNSKGRVKRGQAYTSHNTAKKSPKRKRRLRQMSVLSKAERRHAKRLLPNNF